MPKTDNAIELTGYLRQDFSVCLGCKICASVCSVNDISGNANPQDMLQRIFLGREISAGEPLVRSCTGCYRCTGACPWEIRIPDVVRALRHELKIESPFEKAFKGSVALFGRVYEPYVLMEAVPFLLKGGYIQRMGRWMEYMEFHLPHKVKRT